MIASQLAFFVGWLGGTLTMTAFGIWDAWKRHKP